MYLLNHTQQYSQHPILRSEILTYIIINAYTKFAQNAVLCTSKSVKISITLKNKRYGLCPVKQQLVSAGTFSFHFAQSFTSAGRGWGPSSTNGGHRYGTPRSSWWRLMSSMKTRNRRMSIDRRTRSLSKGSSSGRSAGT